MIAPIDGIMTLEPFVARRRIVFQDCDPAGVVFAGNFYDFVLWAYHLYATFRLQGDGPPIAAPMKAASFVHHAPLWPGDLLDIHIGARSVRRSTYTLAARGVCGDRPVFDAELTLVCKLAGAWTSCPVPESIRARLVDDGAVDDLPQRNDNHEGEDVR